MEAQFLGKVLPDTLLEIETEFNLIRVGVNGDYHYQMKRIEELAKPGLFWEEEGGTA